MWYGAFADLIRRICSNVQHDHWSLSEQLLEELLIVPYFWICWGGRLHG